MRSALGLILSCFVIVTLAGIDARPAGAAAADSTALGATDSLALDASPPSSPRPRVAAPT